MSAHTKNDTGAWPADTAAICQACGACCAFSAEWPRFSLEDDTALQRISRALVDDERGRMRCDGDRCLALVGEVGVSTSCSVYAMRPDVCRACEPGDDACQMARQRFNLRPRPGSGVAALDARITPHPATLQDI